MQSQRLLSTIIAVFWLLSLPASAQIDHVGASLTSTTHPRILLREGEENGIKSVIKADKAWDTVHQAILAESDALLPVAPVERIQIGRRLLDKSREALRRLFFLSYAWRMTHQDKYLQRAEKEMLAISAFSDWNPSHFLDVAEMTMAVAIGYDWLHHDLSANSRSIIKEAILKKGIEPSLDAKYNSWLKATHNWNQVCNAGMTYGALAIYEDQPELAKKIINRAIDSIVLSMGDYGPDGAYPEGYSYWGYGTSFNVLFISALEKATGTDYGLSKQPGFMQTAGYLENMTGPSGNSFNYSDAGTGGGVQPAMFWFAAKANNPSLLWVERSRLTQKEVSREIRNRILPAIMIWSGGLHTNSIPAPSSNLWVGSGKNPVALMRTSWTDPNAIFVGMKGGSPSVNHAHMDVGSFVMEADGVRWAMDLGMQDYNSLEEKGVKIWDKGQDAQRWQVYRYNNFVHNTLTVNNGLQLVEAYAPIISSSNKSSFLSATTDLSSVYQGSLANAKRGISIVDQAYVAIRDEVESASAEATVRWTLLTGTDAKVTGKNRAELTKNGKKLILLVQEPANITLQTWSTVPTNDYDAPNPGTMRVGFEVKVPANTKSALTVLLIPESAESKATKPIQPLAQWPK